MIKLIELINVILNLIKNPKFISVLIFLVLLYHIILYFTRDRIYLNIVKRNPDPKIEDLNDLEHLPLVNIVIPAWKEGSLFHECLLSIVELKYPNIKVIINVGGNEETIRIADSFKKHENFVVLRQKGGKSRAAFGKIKAVNECLDYIEEGIIYIIDADSYVSDEILLRLLYPIVNLKENVVMGGLRILKKQENNDLVRYLEFDRYGHFRAKFLRYSPTMVSGSNTCISYNVLKDIGKFNETRMIAEDLSRGYDILSKGYKIYVLNDHKSKIHTDFPKNIKELIEQRKRYFENSFLLTYKSKEINYKETFTRYLLKFILIFCVSFYILLSPILILFNLGLFFIGLILILTIYLKKIRKLIFFKKALGKENYRKIRRIIYIKLILYIYIELIVNVIALFSSIRFIKMIKREKNGNINNE